MSQEEINALGGKSLSQSECFQSRGKNIRFNRINAYGNHAIGFYFAGVNSYNIAYRCDAYNNTGVDSGSKGNADGFGAHGLGAEFIECRAWDNSDDNYDCISSYGSNLFDSCWSFKLNYTNSDIQDGNGFKVGGWGKSATAKEKYSKYSGDNPPVHVVKNCIATSNKANGFYSNHQPGKAATWFNNRAYNNKANFDMTEGSETWELDSSGKVVDKDAHKYQYDVSNLVMDVLQASITKGGDVDGIRYMSSRRYDGMELYVADTNKMYGYVFPPKGGTKVGDLDKWMRDTFKLTEPRTSFMYDVHRIDFDRTRTAITRDYQNTLFYKIEEQLKKEKFNYCDK